MACSTYGEDYNFISDPNVLRTYSRIMNSRNYHQASLFFSDNLVLDWFGRTVAGKENVLHFLFDEVHLLDHDMIEVKSDTNNVQKKYAIQRALSRFCQPSLSEKEEDYGIGNDSGWGSGFDSSFSSTGSPSPCSKMISSLSRMRVKENLNPLEDMPSDNLKTPLTMRVTKAPPIKRPSNGVRSLKLFEVPRNLHFIDVAGMVSLSKEDDLLSSSPTGHWAKYCHLQIGYHNLPLSSEESVCFSFLFYNDDMPCRRNLSNVFDECA